MLWSLGIVFIFTFLKRLFCTHLHDIIYSHLIQIICTQLYIMNSYLIQLAEKEKSMIKLSSIKVFVFGTPVIMVYCNWLTLACQPIGGYFILWGYRKSYSSWVHICFFMQSFLICFFFFHMFLSNKNNFFIRIYLTHRCEPNRNYHSKTEKI